MAGIEGLGHLRLPGQGWWINSTHVPPHDKEVLNLGMSLQGPVLPEVLNSKYIKIGHDLGQRYLGLQQSKMCCTHSYMAPVH